MNTFFKTHSSLNKIKKNYFTDKSVSLGCIYIVRDPRNVVTSYKNFENWSYNKTLDFMKNDKSFLHANKATKKKLGISGMELINSWSGNYNSWVNNKFNIPICLIKYENLLNNTLLELEKIFEFVRKLNSEKNTKFNLERAKKTVAETNFDNLKLLEKKVGFLEKKEGNRINYFFNQGESNDWNLTLPDEIKKNIENNFYKEMEELGYIK